MLVSLAFAAFVLLITTLDILITLYSLISIIGTTVSVTAVMELSGWSIGIAESITIVILIGFSVDYVVHLANHYVGSSYKKRFLKI